MRRGPNGKPGASALGSLGEAGGSEPECVQFLHLPSGNESAGKQYFENAKCRMHLGMETAGEPCSWGLSSGWVPPGSSLHLCGPPFLHL